MYKLIVVVSREGSVSQPNTVVLQYATQEQADKAADALYRNRLSFIKVNVIRAY